MVFSEELMMLPTPAWQVIAKEPDASGHPRYEPSCRDAPRPRTLLSASRPTFALCVGDRSFPVMTAPQFTGIFLWPLALLRPLHHDDPFLLRKILLALGLASIALAHRLVKRFAAPEPAGTEGPGLAALAALGIAISPCFVLISSIIQTFETLPWTFLLVALLTLSTCPELKPVPESSALAAPEGSAPDRSPSSARLALAAFCVGLSILANVKAVFFIAPLLLLALRLRARFSSLRRTQWALVLASGAAALVPMLLPLAVDPSMRWAQGRGPDWKDRLLENLHHPERLFGALRDLALLFSNFGYYLVHDRLNPVSLAVAALVCAFVAVDTARTLHRRRGCVITATAGVIMLSYVAVVTLLYTEFPANYTPLHAVYGLALGAAAHRLHRFAERRAPRRFARVIAGALAAAVFVPFAWNTAETLRAVGEIPFVTNSRAERDLARYLVEHPEPGTPIVTINLLAGGVIDALSEGAVRTVQAHEWLGACESPQQRERAAACYHERWRALIEAQAPSGALRIVFPTDLSVVRRRAGLEEVQRRELERAASDLHRAVQVERTFHTPGAVPAALLLRLAEPPVSRAQSLESSEKERSYPTALALVYR